MTQYTLSCVFGKWHVVSFGPIDDEFSHRVIPTPLPRFQQAQAVGRVLEVTERAFALDGAPKLQRAGRELRALRLRQIPDFIGRLTVSVVGDRLDFLFDGGGEARNVFFRNELFSPVCLFIQCGARLIEGFQRMILGRWTSTDEVNQEFRIGLSQLADQSTPSLESFSKPRRPA